MKMYQKQNSRIHDKKNEKKELAQPVTCTECIDLYVKCLKSVITEDKDSNKCWESFSNCIEDCNPVKQPQFIL